MTNELKEQLKEKCITQNISNFGTYSLVLMQEQGEPILFDTDTLIDLIQQREAEVVEKVYDVWFKYFGLHPDTDKVDSELRYLTNPTESEE